MPRKSGRDRDRIIPGRPDEFRMGPAPHVREAGDERMSLAEELEVRRRALQEMEAGDLAKELEARRRVMRELNTPTRRRPPRAPRWWLP